jgi:ribonuclease Z
LERLQVLLEVFDWHTWEGLFPISFHPIPEEDNCLFIQYPELSVSASPTVHSKPSIAVRFNNLLNQTAAVYSADTRPCPQVAQLAKDTEILIHEATGPYNGHSTPAQTGAIAHEANTKHLYLVHLSPVSQADRGEIVAQVRQHFSGGVTIAQEFMRVAF